MVPAIEKNESAAFLVASLLAGSITEDLSVRVKLWSEGTSALPRKKSDGMFQCIVVGKRVRLDQA